MATLPDGLAGRGLFVGTPMYDGRCDSAYAFGMVQLGSLCAQLGIRLRCHFACHEALIGRARNATADAFLRSDYDHLMFIDADIGFDARDVLRLLALQAGDPATYDVVAAPYPLKRFRWDQVLRAAKAGLADGDPGRLARVASDVAIFPAADGAFPIDRPLEVTQAGTGFMMVARTTFQRLHASHPCPTYPASDVGMEAKASARIVAFFEPEIDSKRADIAAEVRAFLARSPEANPADVLAFIESDVSLAPRLDRQLSEDYAFCRTVRAAGMSVWLCPWMELSHTGSHRFTSRLADLAALGVA